MPAIRWSWRRYADRSVGCEPFGEVLVQGGGIREPQTIGRFMLVSKFEGFRILIGRDREKLLRL